MNRPDPDSLISAFFDGELDAEEKMTAEELLQNSASAREELEETEKLSELLQQLPVEPAPKDLVHSVIRQAERQTLIPAEDGPTPGEPFFNRRRVFTIAKSLLVTSAMLGGVMFLLQQSHGPTVKENAVATNDFGGEADRFEEVAMDNDGDGIVDETNLSFAANRVKSRFDRELATEELPMPESLAMDAIDMEALPSPPSERAEQPTNANGVVSNAAPKSGTPNSTVAGFGHISNGFWPTSNAAGMAHMSNTAGAASGVTANIKPVTVENVVRFACDNRLGETGKWELADLSEARSNVTKFNAEPDEAEGELEKTVQPGVKGKDRSRAKMLAQGVDKSKLSEAVAGDIVMSLCQNGDEVVPVELTIVDIEKNAGQVNYLFAQNGIPLAEDDMNQRYSVALSDKGVSLRRAKQNLSEAELELAKDNKPVSPNASGLGASSKKTVDAKANANDDFYVLYVEAPAPKVIAALASLEQQEIVTNLSLKQTVIAEKQQTDDSVRLYSELKRNSEVVRQQYYDRNADYIVQDHYSGAQPFSENQTEKWETRSANQKRRVESQELDQTIADAAVDSVRGGKKPKPGRPKLNKEQKVEPETNDGEAKGKGLEVAGSDSSSGSATKSRRYKVGGIADWVKKSSSYLLPAKQESSVAEKSDVYDSYAVPVEQQLAQQKLTVAFQMPVEFDDQLQERLIREEFLYTQPRKAPSPANRSAATQPSADNSGNGAQPDNVLAGVKNKRAIIVDHKNKPLTSPVRLLIVMRGNPMAPGPAAGQPMN